VIKRNNATNPWAVEGNNTLASVDSETIMASNTGLTSFSDFAIGISNQDIVLSNSNFENNTLKVKLFPNPTSGNLTVKLSDSLENATLKIIAITGRTVFEKQNLSGTDFNFDVSNLSQGMYIVQLIDGNEILNYKFIKK
jgi:hypothetical protein